MEIDDKTWSFAGVMKAFSVVVAALLLLVFMWRLWLRLRHGIRQVDHIASLLPISQISLRKSPTSPVLQKQNSENASHAFVTMLMSK